jgi:molybdopterin converting factor small subunit
VTDTLTSTSTQVDEAPNTSAPTATTPNVDPPSGGSAGRVDSPGAATPRVDTRDDTSARGVGSPGGSAGRVDSPAAGEEQATNGQLSAPTADAPAAATPEVNTRGAGAQRVDAGQQSSTRKVDSPGGNAGRVDSGTAAVGSPTAEQRRIGTVLIRYFAGARAAAGVSEERVELLETDNIARVIAAAEARRGTALVRILPSCSFLLNGIAVHDQSLTVPDGAELDVLPPFAGG